MFGKVKVISQTELRVHILKWEWFGVPMEVGAAGFVDAASVADDWQSVGEAPWINWSFGAGVRLRILQNLLFRAELAFSPDEGFAPQPYTWPGYPF